MISIIIPTLWNYKPFCNFLQYVAELSVVGEIIIIDNNNKEAPAHDVLGHKKVRHCIMEKNMFVNPSWNIGARLAKNKYICLLNDDIYFNLVPVINSFKSFIESYPKLGIIGFNMLSLNDKNELNDDSDILELEDTTGMVPFAFGCCMFLKKEDYVQIDESYKIFYGDTLLIVSIVDKQRKRMYYIKNIKCIGRISVSSNIHPEEMNSESEFFSEQSGKLIKYGPSYFKK